MASQSYMGKKYLMYSKPLLGVLDNVLSPPSQIFLCDSNENSWKHFFFCKKVVLTHY